MAAGLVYLNRLSDGPQKFEEWLADRFAAKSVLNDKIVSDLLLPEGRLVDSGAAVV